MKILIIATEKDGMWELQNTVESALPDIEIFACNSFGEAFEYRGAETCELALIEFNLCAGSKRKMLRKIRKMHPGILIYLMVDYLDRGMKLRSYRADGFLLKPIISEDIAYVINVEMYGETPDPDMENEAEEKAESEAADEAERKAESETESEPEQEAGSEAKQKAENEAADEPEQKSFFSDKYAFIGAFCGVIFVVAMAIFGVMRYERWQDSKTLREQQLALLEQIKEAEEQQNIPGDTDQKPANGEEEPGQAGTGIVLARPQLQKKMQVLYEQNRDTIGWLTIPETVINYPVMQTMDDEEYYIDKDFYGASNRNGCLFMDTDSTVGVGTVANEYTYLDEDDRTVTTPPSTNLIIYGHTMKTGDMFGGLIKYAEEEYGRSHSEIYFDTLYEHRRYELIAAFYSKIYNKDQNIFKYYKFFQADTQEEFDYWYENIMVRSVYDTDVTAQFGDEFITLSCCAYEVENGRFVVVGKRVE